jgi:hypothetical protein
MLKHKPGATPRLPRGQGSHLVPIRKLYDELAEAMTNRQVINAEARSIIA